MSATSDASVVANEKPADAPRCKEQTNGVLALNGVVQIGEAAAQNGNIAIGVIAKRDGGLRQAIVSTRDDLKSFDLMDLGPTFGDAPPPKPFYTRNILFAAYYVQDKSRILRARPAAGVLVSQIDFVQGEDESFAFDVVETEHGMVAAWDEDLGNRGVIKLARAGGTPFVVSEESADAESPKLLALDGERVLVSWIKRRIENADAGRDHDIERPAEDRAARSVEYAIVDFAKIDHDAGAPRDLRDGGDVKSTFTVVRGTPENSHVIAIEPSLVRGAPHLFVQDEGEGTEGAGGRVLDLTINIADPQKPMSRVLVPKGVGHALLDYFPTSSDAGYLSFTDGAERQMLAYVDAHADPRPSLEPAIESGRAIAALGSPNVLLGLRVPSENKGAPAELLKLSCVP